MNKKSKECRVSLRLSKFQKEQLEKIANKRDVDLSYIIRYALDLFIDKNLNKSK